MTNTKTTIASGTGNTQLHERVSCEYVMEVAGKPVYLFTLTNSKGHYVKISSYGATVTDWVSTDKEGKLTHNIIGFDDPQSYLQPHPFFGSLVGRFANRIAGGRFELEGETYHLAVNNGSNHLHGGNHGFDKATWNASVDEYGVLHLSYLSKDGEEGYPGNLQAGVSYQFTDNDELRIAYRAKTDKATPVNLTNHCYFDLSGNNEDVYEATLRIHASRYTVTGPDLVPTGELQPVAGTFLDFTTAVKIAERGNASGYDHNYVLDEFGKGLIEAANLIDSRSGKRLDVFTTEPGIQVYTANGLDGEYANHQGKPIMSKTAICLETQHFPDSPNQPEFPGTILFPGKLYTSQTVYRISLA